MGALLAGSRTQRCYWGVSGRAVELVHDDNGGGRRRLKMKPRCGAQRRPGDGGKCSPERGEDEEVGEEVGYELVAP